MLSGVPELFSFGCAAFHPTVSDGCGRRPPGRPLLSPGEGSLDGKALFTTLARASEASAREELRGDTGAEAAIVANEYPRGFGVKLAVSGVYLAVGSSSGFAI